MPYALSEYKKFFSIPEGQTYLNCAGQGPLSKPASAAVIRAMHDKEHPAHMNQDFGHTHVKKCREAVSKLIDYPSHNIALATGTSWGINVMAQGLNFHEGDEVAYFDGQFPSNCLPWLPLEKKGVKVHKIPNPNYIVDLNILKEHLHRHTKILSVEWVHFVSGDRIPLKDIVDICHKKNILVVVDVTQGLGAIPFSMKDVGADAVVCSAYKWLYSPYGSGFLALTDELIEKLDPQFVNWLSIDTDWSNLTTCRLDLCPSAARFDTSAHMGYLNLDGFTASVEWINSLDVAQNFREVQKLTEQLREELDPKSFSPMNTGDLSRQSLIANFRCENKDNEALVKKLAEQGITCSARTGGIRVSPSLYNDHTQISEFTRIANGFCGK